MTRSTWASSARHRLVAGIATAGIAAVLAATTAAPASAAPHALLIGPVNLVNQWTGKCADLPGFGAAAPGTQVTQYNCDFTDNDNQQYKIVPTRTAGSLSLVEFQNIKSNNQCLDLPGYDSVPSGTLVSIFPCAADPARDNQEWYLNDVTGRGDYEIVNYKGGLCLDVSGWASDGSDMGNGTPLDVYPCYNPGWGNNGFDDHLWNLRSS